MKLSKEKIIEAAEAFNKAKSFDEFLVLLDLCIVKLEDFEADYYELASIHPVFINIITHNGKYKTFNSKEYMSRDPHDFPGTGCLKVLDRFRLPLWFEKDESNDISMLMPDKTTMKSSYSQTLVEELKAMGIDANEEIAQLLMYKLGAQ